ncbi:hypothetical protein [Methylobacter svalbardensis]|uniref:hypothetical protein n=1 Tax=Methylobacter svalbardensis TaxID=3080016 RepID=UPI0030EF4C6B
MKVTQQLHDPGQSLWLDNITHGRLTKRGRCARVAGALAAEASAGRVDGFGLKEEQLVESRIQSQWDGHVTINDGRR